MAQPALAWSLVSGPGPARAPHELLLLVLMVDADADG